MGGATEFCPFIKEPCNTKCLFLDNELDACEIATAVSHQSDIANELESVNAHLKVLISLAEGVE